MGDGRMVESLRSRTRLALLVTGLPIAPSVSLLPTCNVQLEIKTHPVMALVTSMVSLPVLDLVSVPTPVSEPLFPEEVNVRSEEHTSELQSLRHLVCRLLL